MSSSSQIIAPNSSQMERAWHILTVLIRLGRPASPSELASRSALDSTLLTPDLVEFLCFVPGSPITLTEHRIVTVSQVAVGALSEFLNRSCRELVPRVYEFRVSELRRDLRLMYSRKRKARPLEVGLVGPKAKRRIFLDLERDVEEMGIQSLPTKAVKVHNDVADPLPTSLSAVGSSNVSNQRTALTLSTPNDSCLLSTLEVKDDDNIRKYDESGKLCDKELDADSWPIVEQKDLRDNTRAITVQNMFLELFGCDGSLAIERNIVTSNSDIVGRVEKREPDARPTLIDKEEDKTLLWMETLGEDSCIVPAAPLAVRYEVNSAPSIFPKAEIYNNEPSIEFGSLLCKVGRTAENEIAAEVNRCETKILTFPTDLSRKEQVQTPSKLDYTGRSLSAEPNIMNGSASTIRFQKPKHGSNTKKKNSLKHDKHRRNEEGDIIKQKTRSHLLNTSSKEDRQETAPMIPKINPESNLLPNFESFIIEEEEGKGGYGTVYKARRKEDGKIFAVKHPHPNAHSHHVHNEMKMLERFGGRNFVIKYECTFKSGQSECFVLEHVEHDRPEVLKKVVDVFELQWYGYCMFRALASLHKQGVVHRDVKPGNFLFSRKLKKGYLIDFNLASDLHQNFSKNSRAGSTSRSNLDPSLSATKSALSNFNKELGNGSRKIVLKNMKKRSNKDHIENFTEIDNNSKYGSQAADSGVTSAKDLSTRTHSADRLKQPIPCKGRKELISFVQAAMQSPSHKEVIGPVSQRKRIAAPLGNMNNRLMIVTPMPLHSGGNVIAGAGMSNKGNGKHKRDGPCVGTKGFRAPEVLFKSYHQGCKVDIWSAGVTLLYLIIGKSPFCGNPEQNIKEIANLRGSEELWEVAKLHNCESSYPSDLFDVRYLQSVKLRDWCRANTKRPEFLELVPQSMFDLVDRCLTVNPRRRITAEEALMHSFFAPCHESLRKQRLLRRTIESDSISGSQPPLSMASSNNINASIDS